MFSMSLLFYHSSAHRSNHLLIYIHHQPVWQQRPFHDLQSRDELRQLQQSDRSCSNLQPCCFNNVTKGRKRIGFLEKVDHFGDDIDDGDDVGGDDDSDDSRDLPAGLSGRTFLMKMPITLCC